MLSNGVGEVSPVFYLQLFKCPPGKVDSWILTYKRIYYNIKLSESNY